MIIGNDIVAARGAPTKHLLVVTGSRSIADHPGGEEWVKDHLRQVVRVMEEPGSELAIITGDARGPDAWAREIAIEGGLSCFVYRLSGLVTNAHGAVFGVWDRYSCVDQSKRDTSAWPLERNKGMAHAVGVSMGRGSRMTPVAFVDPASRTHGTVQTLGLLVKLKPSMCVEFGWRQEAARG